MTSAIMENIENKTDLLIYEMDTPIDFDEVKSNIKSILAYSNIVLLRSKSMNQERFKILSEGSGDDFMSYAGGAFERPLVEQDKTMMEVTGPKLKVPVPLHGEMYYQKKMPDRLWFYCQNAPRIGGETLVCDGGKFFSSLSGRAQDALLSNKVRYINTYDFAQWQSIFQTDDVEVLKKCCEEQGLELSLDNDQSVRTEYVANPIVEDSRGIQRFINNIFPILAAETVLGNKARVVRWEDGNVIPEWMLSEFIELTTKIAHPHKWQTGDLIVVNNHEVLHGRNVIQGEDRRIIVRLSNSTKASA